MKKQCTHLRGSSVLIVVIIISAMLITISLTMGYGALQTSIVRKDQSNATQAFINIDGCAEEGLVRLNRNNAYTGESFTLDGTSCTLTVSGTGPTRTMEVDATAGDYERHLTIEIVIYTPFQITSWQETAD
jgi:hypothetical protein